MLCKGCLVLQKVPGVAKSTYSYKGCLVLQRVPGVAKGTKHYTNCRATIDIPFHTD